MYTVLRIQKLQPRMNCFFGYSFFAQFSHTWDLSENRKEMAAKQRKILNCNRIQHLYYLCLSRSWNGRWIILLVVENNNWIRIISWDYWKLCVAMTLKTRKKKWMIILKKCVLKVWKAKHVIFCCLHLIKQSH